IHERASSSHIQYQTLREHFRHSDVLFRFQRLMSMQGQACQQLDLIATRTGENKWLTREQTSGVQQQIRQALSALPLPVNRL
ncbi:hypothetical protein MMT22_29915, partial [Escherichia coli]|nr:hypothetical protein [Escherichia coli]